MKQDPKQSTKTPETERKEIPELTEKEKEEQLKRRDAFFGVVHKAPSKPGPTRPAPAKKR